MTTQAKDSWLVTRLPYAATFCATIFQKNRAPGGSYFAVLPFLLTVAAAFLTLSGVALAVYYNPWHAFDSVQFIDRNVNNGWLVHAYHATGTTMIFAVLYIYLFHAVLTRAYRAPGEFVWVLGVKLLAVLLLTGWLGFVLTGGAAGYWSLFNAANGALALGGLPGAVGIWFFGGPAGGDTLARLEIFHVLLALSALLVVVMLRAGRKTAAASAPAPARLVAFYPYYLAQYFAALAVFAFIFAVLAFYAPHFGTSHVNLLPAGSLTLSASGVPWYLAPAAALIGVFPGAGGGILAAIAAVAVLYALPWLDRSGANGARSKLYVVLIWVLALDVLGLGATAHGHCAGDAIWAGIFTAWYFFHFLVLTPVVTSMEAE